ncbi:hypothetical protein [Streptomyces viridochromogenes]|nr:hypothetical protein [Streptomyces viridochromogenes]
MTTADGETPQTSGAATAAGTTSAHDPWMKVLHWAFFSVIFAVLPIAAGYLIDATRQGDRSFSDLISHGELYIVSAGLTAAAVGQSFMKKSNKHRFLHAILTFTNIGLFFLTSFLYADAVAPNAANDPEVRRDVMAELSLWFFAITLITTGASTVLAEVEE